MRRSLAELIPAGGRSTLPDGAASAGAATATIGSHPLALTLALACVPPPLPCRAAIAKDGPPALPHASLYEMFMDSVSKYPGNPCLGRREGAGYAWLTYGEAAEQAGALGSALVAVGLQPHGRVGVYGANSPEWMLAMQGVLWPENAADCELGRPVIAELPTDATVVAIVSAQLAGSVSAKSVDVEQVGDSELIINGSKRVYAFYAPIPTPGFVPVGAVPGVPMPGITPGSFAYPPGTSPTAALSAAAISTTRSKDMLPYGMRNALDAAIMLGIAEIADVETIIEAFRWMAWCFHCLHVLRIPPATHTLRNLLKCARPFKLSDEKVLRTVNGILTRAWYVLTFMGAVLRSARPDYPPPAHRNTHLDIFERNPSTAATGSPRRGNCCTRRSLATECAG